MSILNRLTIRHLKLNKKRTIVSIIGIILSTALMVGIGLLFSTLRDNAIQETLINRGSYHSMLGNVRGDDIEEITKTPEVKDYFLNTLVSYAKRDDSEDDSYIRIEAADMNYMKEIELVRGRLPQNEHEILVSNGFGNEDFFKIGNEITLSTGVFLIDGEESVTRCDDCLTEEDEFVEKKKETYKIVGFYGINPYVSWRDPVAITILSKVSSNSSYNIYFHFKEMKDTEKITSQLEEKYGNGVMDFNSSLLGLSGISKYDNIVQSLAGIMIILLSLVSIGCIIVIYNSFAISVLERKKQFGLFASIGATKRQIQKTVLFEAVVVGVIGIFLGILGAFLGIGIVLMIINYLVPNMLNGVSFRLCVYPLFVIVPIIFMTVTIFASALIPARRASKISPIEAIRLNDDIKMPARSLKTPRILHVLFQEEGVIAYKNMKRNKKKYRITIISLFISIVLFLSFSSYMQLVFNGVEGFLSNPNFDATLNLFGTDLTEEDVVNLGKEKGVNRSFYGVEYSLIASGDLKKNFTDSYGERYIEGENLYSATLLEVSKSDYEIYKQDAKVKKDIPLIYNNFSTIVYKKNSRKSYMMKKFASDKIIPFDLCESKYIEQEDGGTIIDYSCEKKISEYALLNHDFFGIEEHKSNTALLIIIPKGYFGDLSEFNDGIQRIAYFDLDKSDDFNKKMDSLIEQGRVSESSYFDIRESVNYTRNMIFVVKLLVYGFISLVSLIGITSVFNTLYTSIHLRRKEFAVLRSMGLTTGGFNRMLLFECLFFGLKSLLYSLPVSAVLILLINRVMENVSSAGEVLWPVGSIVGVIFAVFFIILLTTMYATRKIKRENIMEAIREENI